MAAGAGRLIAFEGGEGSGKSTQAKALAETLGAELTREPGGTPLGERLRRLLLDEPSAIDPRAELMMMLAARAQHLAEVIEPALAAGRHVVVDRFAGSTLAYQGYGRGLPLAEVKCACLLASAGRQADLNILLDLPVSAGSVRRGLKEKDRIEAAGPEFHDRVRQGFLAEAEADPVHWCVLDGSPPADEVAAAVRHVVAARLGLSLARGD